MKIILTDCTVIRCNKIEFTMDGKLFIDEEKIIPVNEVVKIVPNKHLTNCKAKKGNVMYWYHMEDCPEVDCTKVFISADKYEFIWITPSDNGFDVEIDIGSEIVPAKNCKSVSSAKRWVACNINKLKTKWMSKEEI